VQTPRFWGHAPNAGTVLLLITCLRGVRTNWLMVAMLTPNHRIIFRKM